MIQHGGVEIVHALVTTMQGLSEMLYVFAQAAVTAEPGNPCECVIAHMYEGPRSWMDDNDEEIEWDGILSTADASEVIGSRFGMAPYDFAVGVIDGFDAFAHHFYVDDQGVYANGHQIGQWCRTLAGYEAT